LDASLDRSSLPRSYIVVGTRIVTASTIVRSRAPSNAARALEAVWKKAFYEGSGLFRKPKTR